MQKTANCTWHDFAGSDTVAPHSPAYQCPERLSVRICRTKALRVSAKMLRIMRIIAFIMLAFCLQVSATGSSQTVTISGKNIPLRQVLQSIEKQTGFLVWGKLDILEKAQPVTVTVSKMPVTDFLTLIMEKQPFSYKLEDNTIILLERSKPQPTVSDLLQNKSPKADIGGFVMNLETGEPIRNASVLIKGTNLGYTTDESGRFSFSELGQNAVLVISSVGFHTLEIRVAQLLNMPMNTVLAVTNATVRKAGNSLYMISLTPARTELGEVVINTGIFKRDQKSFTGSASTFTGDQLKLIGNKNVIESLKTLDPAFIKLDNNLQGSNPNRLPNIELRGRTTLTNANLNDQFNSDPNQPLFILDGFETTLQVIYDLDMNRIASITLLKDAASTALYGSKAANGVVVVETKRPVPGQLRTSYVADFSFELPDLSSYNLMNSTERLQWEELAFGTRSGGSPDDWRWEERKSARRADVERGVNTYWLHEPVQTGVTNRHSLQLNGGNNDLIFNAGASYNNQNGVMKGSKREGYGGNVTLTYRKGRLNITEMASIAGTKANESPYGSFATFATALPYYRKRNDDGTISKKLDPIYDTAVINPLYNASLYSINENENFTFINNLRGIYSLTNELRLEGGLQLTKATSDQKQFVPPDNTTFDGMPNNQKGSYRSGHGEINSYTANLTVAYGTAIGKSQITAVARGQIENSNSESIGFSIVGFPYGTNGNPAFAFGFTPYSTPQSSKIVRRAANFTSNVSYNYDNRFMLDGVYTLNGSSAFGSNKRSKPFVSGGAGWNLSREVMFRNISWLQLLKIRGNIGYSGNENLGNFTSVSTYSFISGNNNNFGQGLSLASLGSPDLEWSKTLQQSYGMDFSLMNSRISGSVEYYIKETDPLSVGAEGTLSSSVALNNNFVINVGKLTTKGWNFNLRANPIYDLKNRVIWTISVSGVKVNSVYGDFSNRLESLNKAEQESNGLLRYYDGYSPDDIWAVESKGIDPATGNEIFQKKDGTLSYYYNPIDIVRVGNTRPDLEGIVGSSFTYHDFTLGVNLRYRTGGYVFNSALYSKVENTFIGNGFATSYINLDKRALYDRWQQPGDVSEFTAINSFGGIPMSSRFVQKDNHLVGESFAFSWRSSANWVKRIRMQAVNVNLYLNDIFRVESVQSERGLEFPFSRSAGLSVNATF